MFVHNLSPTIIHLGPLEIRWYGLMYVLGFLAVHAYTKRAIKEGKLTLTEQELDDFLGQLVIAMIVGARVFYALFYNPSYFIQTPWKIFFVWEGGLSFHGGFIGMLLWGYHYSRKKNIPLLHLADIFCVPLALGNAFGRIGNFINAELYGIPTTLPWGVLFPGADLARHPTQLYEAAYNIVIFAVLYSLRNKKLKPGTLFGIYVLLYSICRFFVEFIKDLPMFGPLTMGQWLTIPLFILGIYLALRNR